MWPPFVPQPRPRQNPRFPFERFPLEHFRMELGENIKTSTLAEYNCQPSPRSHCPAHISPLTITSPGGRERSEQGSEEVTDATPNFTGFGRKQVQTFYLDTVVFI